MSGKVSPGLAGEYQSDERAGVARLSWVSINVTGAVKESNTGRDGISCPLLGNESPQNKEQLLSPFPRPHRVGLAESRVQLQTRRWPVPHHQ